MAFSFDVTQRNKKDNLVQTYIGVTCWNMKLMDTINPILTKVCFYLIPTFPMKKEPLFP